MKRVRHPREAANSVPDDRSPPVAAPIAPPRIDVIGAATGGSG